jgi:hypothetical protein
MLILDGGEAKKKWQYLKGQYGREKRKRKNSGSVYFNYKLFCSMNLLCISDADYKILYCDVGVSGHVADGVIFDTSIFKQMLDSGALNLPADDSLTLPGSDIHICPFFGADAAYALNKNVIKPFGGAKLSNHQKIFNYRQFTFDLFLII